MLDIKFIRDNQEVIRESLKKQKDSFDLDKFFALDQDRRNRLTKREKLLAKQNEIGKEIQKLVKEKKDVKAKIQESKELKKQADDQVEKLRTIQETWNEQLKCIPNIPHESVPIGDVSCNKIIKTEGKLRKFDFKPLSHIELAERLDIIDFKRASKISGSNFSLFKGAGAQLSRALINFMLDLHTQKHSYKEIFPPFLVNKDSMTTTGQLPKFKEDMYYLENDGYFLIPTAEVPVTNIHSNEILREDDLPINYVSYSACFRREAGSYGKDTRGLSRVHQFNKVELVKFVKPQSSYDELENLLGNACSVLKLLEIPYKVVLLSTQEISFASTKCYDIEIYAPGIDKWLEVSSCSNFEGFQARRARGGIKYRDKKTGENQYVHTLNASGVALPRLIASLLENYQEKDGTIIIPKVLQGYMNGKKTITDG